MKKWLFIALQLAGMQILSLIILFSPAREKIQNTLFPKQDKLLAVIYGDLTGTGAFVKVLKFKTKEGIRLEFLEQNRTGARRLISEKNIRHPYNGFFEYRGNSVQLAMGDVDGDGIMEVMAPSFDQNLIAHLNVFYYDENSDRFKRNKRSYRFN